MVLHWRSSFWPFLLTRTYSYILHTGFTSFPVLLISINMQKYCIGFPYQRTQLMFIIIGIIAITSSSVSSSSLAVSAVSFSSDGPSSFISFFYILLFHVRIRRFRCIFPIASASSLFSSEKPFTSASSKESVASVSSDMPITSVSSLPYAVLSETTVSFPLFISPFASPVAALSSETEFSVDNAFSAAQPFQPALQPVAERQRLLPFIP